MGQGHGATAASERVSDDGVGRRRRLCGHQVRAAVAQRWLRARPVLYVRTGKKRNDEDDGLVSFNCALFLKLEWV